MDCKEVFDILRDIFPQVDSRILKAVAIEHSDDVEAAVHDILTDVIPCMSRRAIAFSPPQDPVPEVTFNAGVEHEKQRDCSMHKKVLVEANVGHEDSNSVEAGLNDVAPVKSNALMHEDRINDDDGLLHVNSDTLEPISSGICEQFSVLGPTCFLENGADGNSNDFNTNVCKKFNHVESLVDSTLSVAENFKLGKIPPFSQNPTPIAPECHLLIEFDGQKLHWNGSSDHSSKQDRSAGEISDPEDESTMIGTVTHSGQQCRIDLLEEIIEDAKNNKKILFSAVESVINLMREVELKEKSVEQAQEEAAKWGGSQLLVNAENLKHMLACAKEANNMHSGEVYGEKSILATELMELQSRLLSLADERDKYLSILDEMSRILEARLVAAEEMRKVAEQEKLGKEEYARNVLTEKEALMEKVIQESKMLEKEAEENSKLQEFVVDRGCVVDTLQGEISVICQDVRLLKEKFDERVPLSKSISSSQTSCILASTGTSLKRTAPNMLLSSLSLNDMSSNLPNRRQSSSVDDLSPIRTVKEERGRDGNKELSDDGWDIFDKDAESAN